jgi:hypothetical protein
MVYSSFESFIESLIIPRRKANPAHIRLDGNTSGGNREVFGVFQHSNKIWKVHADTHYEPLLLAYDLIKKREIVDPFVRETTNTGSGTCLVLQKRFQRLLSKPRFKYLYIYEA